MVLGFMQKFPWGDSTDFDFKILSLYVKEFSNYTPKIHTVRAGQRWKPGMKLHMAQGVRTEYYRQFNIAIPELQTVKSVQRIDIIHRGPGCCIVFIDRKVFYSRLDYLRSTFHKSGLKVRENKEHNRAGFLEFLQNDGVTEEQFWKFFKKPLRDGQLIHWTDKKY